MNQQTTLAAVIAVLLLIAAIVIFHASGTTPTSVLSDTSSSTPTVSSTSVAVITGVSNTGASSKIPSFAAPLIFTSNVSADVQLALHTQFDDIVAQLKTVPTRTDLWFSLGTIRKMAGDYPAAIEDWNYVATTNNSLSGAAHRNLADLYMNFIKDYPKAEANYLAAIQLEPAALQPYSDLATLYSTTSYHPTQSATEDILKKGISANPTAVELQVALARYYVSVGRISDAKAAYSAARTNAASQGNTSLAAQIQQEENSL